MARKRKRARDKSTDKEQYAFEQEAVKKSVDAEPEQKTVKTQTEEKKPAVKTAPPKATAKKPPGAGSRMGSFLKEVRAEMKKVNWPDQERTVQSTLTVIGTLVALSIVMSLFTMLFTKIAGYFWGD